MAASFKSFDLIRLDASGARVELPNETLTIKKVSDDSTLDTVESDDFGYVASETITGTEGEEIYFEHATYPERFYQTLGVPDEETTAISEFATFIVENLFVSVSDAVVIDIYIKEDGSENINYLGSMSPNSTASFPKEVNTSKDFTLYSVPRDSSGQRRTTDFTQTKTEALSVTVRRFGYAIKDFFADVANVGTSETDLYKAVIPANTLTTDGDKLIAEIGGIYAANANNKFIYAQFQPSDYIFSNAAAVTQSGGAWKLDIFIIRVSATFYRATTVFTRFVSGGSTGEVQYATIGSLTPESPMDFIISGVGAASNDITAKMGYVKFEPAAVESEPEPEGEANNVIHLGDNVIHNTDNVIYTE